MKEPVRAEEPPSKPAAPPTSPPPPAAENGAPPAKPLTPEEQMERFAQELKENDWGHQPC